MPRPEPPNDIARLRRAAERCVCLLGTGILQFPSNGELRARLSSGALEEQHFGRQLQIRVLQVVAWCIGERLGAVPLGMPKALAEYQRNHAASRWRVGAANSEGSQAGLSANLQRVLHGLWQGDKDIGVESWNSDLFDPAGVSDLVHLPMSDAQARSLIATVQNDILDADADPDASAPALGTDVQLLGRIHEWLLQLRVVVDRKDWSVDLHTVMGHQRRATGSYFTPNDLVEDLLGQILDPLLEERVTNKSGEEARAAVLKLRIVDPACGTGAFLLAAAKRVAKRLAAIRSSFGDSDERSKNDLADVVACCLYGVDIGETTVQLCRLALWFEMGPPFCPRAELDRHIQCGNSIFGAWPESLTGGIPDIAFTASPTDDARVARSLRRRNRIEKAQLGSPVGRDSNPSRSADLWCAAFVWPKVVDEPAPTHATLFEPTPSDALATREHSLRDLRSQYRFFHWHLRFPDVLSGADTLDDSEQAQRGFDLVIGNPPWVAHAGRSTQILPHGLKNCLVHSYRSFSGYPTTHGVFVDLATRIVAVGGRLGLIIPASVADLDGYAATRSAHDARCELVHALPDYGEGRFTGVTQPCVALISRCTGVGRHLHERGKPWPLERTDLDATGTELLARWHRLDVFPAVMFGERGFQSTPQLRKHVCVSKGPEGRYTLPMREGADVREFQLGAARLYVDAGALGNVLRPLVEFVQVALVVRQTARYPIAARNDGCAFRNSLLAVLSHEKWHWSLMLSLLNSALFRWIHFHRYRDGRQPILPQLKVGHLRSLAIPPILDEQALAALSKLGLELATRNDGILEAERVHLDDCVAKSYGLNSDELRMVTEWHSNRPR